MITTEKLHEQETRIYLLTSYEHLNGEGKIPVCHRYAPLAGLLESHWPRNYGDLSVVAP
jgi:hypothetical protein